MNEMNMLIDMICAAIVAGTCCSGYLFTRIRKRLHHMPPVHATDTKEKVKS